MRVTLSVLETSGPKTKKEKKKVSGILGLKRQYLPGMHPTQTGLIHSIPYSLRALPGVVPKNRARSNSEHHWV